MKTVGDEKYSAGVKLVETVVFVPTTPNSGLRKMLQKVNDQLCLSVNSPSVRFVERGGPTLMDTVGRNNPNAKVWYCPRQDCEPCKGRRILGAEEAEDTVRRAEGHQVPKRTREDRTALPCCTGEGVNYLLECVKCRREGKVRRYYGETSRSAYQRG